MRSNSVARRYAAGIFAVAMETKDLEGWRLEMAKLDELFQDEVLMAAFENPAVDTARRIELARRLAPELRSQAQNFMRLLIERQRTREMSAIRTEYDRLADEASGIVHVTLTAAVDPAAGERDSWRRTLAQRLGRDVRLRVEVDPALIGGATIQIGDHLVDGSVRWQLNRLRQMLLS